MSRAGGVSGEPKPNVMRVETTSEPNYGGRQSIPADTMTAALSGAIQSLSRLAFPHSRIRP